VHNYGSTPICKSDTFGLVSNVNGKWFHQFGVWQELVKLPIHHLAQFEQCDKIVRLAKVHSMKTQKGFQIFLTRLLRKETSWSAVVHSLGAFQVELGLSKQLRSAIIWSRSVGHWEAHLPFQR